MGSKAIVNDLLWIDEAFSKNYVDELEAACCLTEGQNRVYFGDKVSGYFVDYQVHSNLRRNYRVITTWNFPRRCLFDFIDKAIAKNLQSFRKEFLLKKCYESFLTMSFDSQKRFKVDYYYISCALDLMVRDEDATDDGEPESLLDGVNRQSK